MKNCFVLVGLIIAPIAFGAPCDGAPGKNHINPDGTKGGFVASTSSVGKTVFLDAGSSVCEQAKVKGNVKIKSGSWIGGSVIVEGSSEITSSKVFGVSKIHRNAQVEKSSVCQASDIYFKVSESDYYCQTDDPEPKHPGELSKKSLIGIDSDGDGVRDDIEIWINNRTTNSSSRDMYNIRMSLKEAAKIIQKNLLAKENKEASRQLKLQMFEAFECLLDLSNSKNEFNRFESDFAYEFFNTKERIEAEVKTRSSLAGYAQEIISKPKFSTCSFKLK